MISHAFEKFFIGFSKIKHWRLILFAFVFFFSLAIISLPISLRPSPYELKVGDVASQDIRASHTFSYTSKLLTEQAQTDAAKKVSPVYLPADPSVTRRQIGLLQIIVNEINSIRDNKTNSSENKIQALTEIKEILISQEMAKDILLFDEPHLLEIEKELFIVLEQVMHNSIRPEQVSDFQENISVYINLSFSEIDAQFVQKFISPLITANSIYSNEKTNELIQNTQNNITPIIRTFQANESIVTSGQIITPQVWEALQTLGLVQENNSAFEIASSALLIFVLLFFPSLYLRQVKRSLYDDCGGLIIIGFAFIFFLLTVKLIITNHTLLPYLFPIAAFGLSVASVFDFEIGILTSISLSILCCFLITNSNDLLVFYLLSSSIGILLLGKGRRMRAFYICAIGIGVVGGLIIIAYQLATSYLDLQGLPTLIGVAFINGLVSISLTLILQFIFALVLGRTTALQLMDLSRSDQPLLQYLLSNAPGTYQHSLQTANIAEQAAEVVKCDPLLTRVGALYHDIGKAKNPNYFIENQISGQIDAHKEIDPQLSAKTIIRHVADGISLAEKYNLPPQIANFIQEHHGNTLARFQYIQALDRSKKENKPFIDSGFHYPGPCPNSRESALIMLADGCEARAKAENPKSNEEINKIVTSTISYYLDKGQLNNVNLTFRDIKLITGSFENTLINIYHKRIKYPSKR